MGPVGTDRIRFDRQELAGAFGDIGTDLPLLLALVGTCQLDPTSVLVCFGLAQIATGIRYGLPMPVQPLKAMAAVMLAKKLGTGVLTAGGVVVGAAMAILVATGALEHLARGVPKPVVRGIQLGLAITLATLALKEYAAADGLRGYFIVAVGFCVLILARNRKLPVPAPLIVMTGGVAYGLLTKADPSHWKGAFGFHLPHLIVPKSHDWIDGALLLALPQIPLSLGNSVIATSDTTKVLFPTRPVAVRSIGVTFAAMNLIAPWFGGFPTCHGCGGLVGFYGFGARTGGAAILYGAAYLAAGLFAGPAFADLALLFPLPILGVVLFVEALGLATLAADGGASSTRIAPWTIAIVAAAVVALPYGYVVGLLAGTLFHVAAERGWIRLAANNPETP